MKFTRCSIGLLMFAVIVACQPASESDPESAPQSAPPPLLSETSELSIPFEKYILDNGLEVVMHQDHSDPIVAIALLYHVGSAREVPGRTGFAHLFEHLLFQSSENLGEGAFITGIPALGGVFNGGTSNDMTIYFESVPIDALERVLWMESDRLGFFINTVTQPRMENEKQIVKNEKRQRVDNVPYGHTSSVIDSSLYPPTHPYNWQVIGSLADLEAATLADVREFYEKYYGPQNVTLVISGDIDSADTKALVERYFGEIPAGEEIAPITVADVTLAETRSFYHQDNFAQLPELTMAWPTVENFHPDSYALTVLGQLLSDGRKSPFYKVVVEELKLAAGVSANQRSRELAGKFQISARGFSGVDLDDLNAAFNQAFARFEADGIGEADLERIKAGLETDFYNGISGVMDKAFQLARYNTFAGDPGFLTEDLANSLDVSIEDVMDVYQRYVKDQHYIATSFVPKGQLELALSNALEASVFTEQIVTGAEAAAGNLSATSEFTRTASLIDRSQEPALGTAPSSAAPEIWATTLENGMSLLGITQTEVPLVNFTLRLQGGMLLDNPDKIGVANLTAEMLLEGTENRTPEQLEEAIRQLGASIDISASPQWITFSATTLARNYPAVVDLITEILLEPRWEEERFALVKERTLSNIRQNGANPNAIASSVFRRLVYGSDNILANNVSGDEETVAAITLADLKAYYAAQFSPSVATVNVVGDISASDLINSLVELTERWEAKPVVVPQPQFQANTDGPGLYFVDVPNAPQSVIRVGYMAMPLTDPDFYPASVMNHQLGGGITGRLFQTLRIQNGYTYGAGSRFTGTALPGPFTVSTSVRANVTMESMALINEILEGYAASFSEVDLLETQNAMIRSNFVKLETSDAQLNMLQNISSYGLAQDYVSQREAVVRGMSVRSVQELANRYIDTDQMIYVVVGDAATQLERLTELGYENPIMLDSNGKRIADVESN